MAANVQRFIVSDCATVPAACRICGGALGAALLVHTVRDRFEVAVGVGEAGYNRAWRRCDACGVVQNVQSQENENKLDSLAEAYYEVDLGNNIKEKFNRVMSLPPASSDNVGRVARIIRQLGGAGPSFGRPRHVLDIGAGLGVFLAEFLERVGDGWVGTAVEPDPNAAAHLRSLGRFNVVQSVFTGTEMGIPVADLVTLNKVVEHVANPAALLRVAGSILNPASGVLYVEVPDELTISRRPATDNILGALHKHLYSPRSLSALIERSGLQSLRVERVFEPSGKITVFAFAAANSAIVPQDLHGR